MLPLPSIRVGAPSSGSVCRDVKETGREGRSLFLTHPVLRVTLPAFTLFFPKTFLRGAVAQLGARVNGIHEVAGSIPASSTIYPQQAGTGWLPPEFIPHFLDRSLDAPTHGDRVRLN